MKKRLKRYITVLLIAAFLICLPVYAGADSTGICFTSTDDTLLDLSLSPVYYSGVPYVSARVFANFGIYYSYYASDLTAQLYNNSKQIFFDMDVSNAYDANMTEYQVSAMYRNGVTYVPVEWVSNYFNLTFSYISGVGYGDVLRIKSGYQVLSDSQFLNGATSWMQIRYNEYYGYYEYSESTAPAVPETPEVSDNKSGTLITLSFIGLPSARLLDTFDRYGLRGCFFLTAEEALENPDTVRRIAGSGHTVGIYSSGTPSADITLAADAIFLAAQIMPSIVTSPSSSEAVCREYAESNALVYFSPGYNITGSNTLNSITTKLDSTIYICNLCFSSIESAEGLLSSVLQYLAANKFSVIALRETII